MVGRMKTLRKTHVTNLALALTLIALRPAIAADGTGHMSHGSVATEGAVAGPVTLESIDRQIEAIEDAIEDAPKGADRTAAEARLKVLKDRRRELRNERAEDKLRELQTDAKAEYQKVAAWAKRSGREVKEEARELKDDVSDTASEVGARARAGIAAAGASTASDRPVYRLNPAVDNKAEVKAALDALHAEIELLEDRAEAMPKGAKRTALEKRVDDLEKRHAELKRDFTKARWDATLAEVKREWNQLTD